MLNHPDRRLGEQAAAHHGVFTRSEARAVGISDRSIDARAAVGRYERIEPGVYAVAGAPRTPMRRLAGAIASFPALAAVSHQTAAEMWGLTDRGIRVIEVVTTRWDRVRRKEITVHESLDLLDEDVVELHGIPVTTPARTVVDLGASNRWIVEAALESGIRRGLFTLGEVAAFVDRVARRGRRGVGVIRPLIEARARWDAATESELEDRFRRLLADAGLPDPEPQFVVRDRNGTFVARADFAYPAARLLVELDSEAHHLDRIAFRRDRSKHNRASMLGWLVLRYTWWDLVEEPGRVCSEVRAAVAPRPT
jgi:very-short-patch-repair endonuclease